MCSPYGQVIYLTNLHRSAICASKNTAHIQQTFDFVRNHVSGQDWVYFFSVLGSGPASRRLLSLFFKEHYDEVRRISEIYVPI